MGDIPGIAHTLHGNLFIAIGDARLHVLALIDFREQIAQQRRIDNAGQDDVAADIIGRVLRSDVAAQTEQRRLGRGV